MEMFTAPVLTKGYLDPSGGTPTVAIPEATFGMTDGELVTTTLTKAEEDLAAGFKSVYYKLIDYVHEDNTMLDRSSVDFYKGESGISREYANLQIFVPNAKINHSFKAVSYTHLTLPTNREV